MQLTLGRTPGHLARERCCYRLDGVLEVSARVGSTETELPTHRPYRKLVVGRPSGRFSLGATRSRENTRTPCPGKMLLPIGRRTGSFGESRFDRDGTADAPALPQAGSRQAIREILPRCNALSGEHPDTLPGKDAATDWTACWEFRRESVRPRRNYRHSGLTTSL